MSKPNLYGRSLLTLLDYTTEEINYLIDLSSQLKKEKKTGVPHQRLAGKNIVLLFQKDSTRTRCAFEVAAFDLGMHTVYLGPEGSQFGKKESVEDSAKVLGRMFDGIQFRGYLQSDVVALAKYAGVPVWNGLTDDYHPTQMIADFLTIKEHLGDLKGRKLVFVGDARNNVANSLMITSAKLGMHFVALAPDSLFPNPQLVARCQEIAKTTGGSIACESDITIGTDNADVIYTDVWVSMGETDWTRRLELLHGYQVNMAMFRHAKPTALFLHCLPAFHDLGTSISKEMAKKYGNQYPVVKNGEFEVTDEVIRSKHSVVFDEAENRLHSIKAIILATLEK